MDEIPSGLHPTKCSPREHLVAHLLRALLTTLVVATGLAVVLGHEDPAIFLAVRDALFHPAPTPTVMAAPSLGDVLHHRSLNLPVVSPGRPCPTLLGRAVAPGIGTVVGDGPVYVVLSTQDTLDYAPPQTFGSQEWGGQKTLWAVQPGFRGFVLVRGQQVDGSNEVRFGRGDVPNRELLLWAPVQIAPNPEATTSGWSVEIRYTRVRAPGCYAYQMDGETFSTTVVFRVEALSPSHL